MNNLKFAKMVGEFPFLNKILTQQNLFADSIGSIKVVRGDRNLLEVTPCAWADNAGGYGSHEGFRSFWHVIPGEVGPFSSSWRRSIVPHGTTAVETAPPIGPQLLSLNQDVLFIVEIYLEAWDYEDKIHNVVVYKMQRFDWRRFARSA